MEEFTLIALPHKEAYWFINDEGFVMRLIKDIENRVVPHIPQVAYNAYYTMFGPQFNENATLFVHISKGNIAELTTEEQEHLKESLRLFREHKQ